MTKRSIYVGTASWAIPRAYAEEFPPSGTGLERYAATFGAVEINTTFYRRHLASTFERWARAVPRGFRFAVKMPRTITHEAGLVGARGLLEDFFDDVRPLGAKLGPVLVQLPPSLAFDGRRASAFFRALRAMHGGAVVCEPRHASWYGPRADALFLTHDVARVAADPPVPAEAASPGGSGSLVYLRLHGSPHRYYSEYGPAGVEAALRRVREASRRATVWCVFDNTAAGAATGDALRLVRALQGDRSPAPRRGA